MNTTLKIAGIVLVAALVHVGTIHDWSMKSLSASGGDPVNCNAAKVQTKCDSIPNHVCDYKDDDTYTLNNMDWSYTNKPTKDTVCRHPDDCKPTAKGVAEAGCTKVTNVIVR